VTALLPVNATLRVSRWTHSITSSPVLARDRATDHIVRAHCAAAAGALSRNKKAGPVHGAPGRPFLARSERIRR
jgi:hypothetical protein